MKKRTLVCFLIFTLCVFYSSIPNTVLGQEVSLAQQVFDKHSETLQREDIQAVLPQVFNALKDPAFQQNPQVLALGGLDGALDLVLLNPDLILVALPDTDPQFVALLKTDQDVRAIFADPDVRTILKDPAAIDELAGLLNVGAEPPVEEPPVVVEPPVEEPPVVVEPPVEEPPVVVEPPVEEPPVVVEPPVEEPPVVVEPPMEIPTVDPFEPIMPTNESLVGRSKLGGLSLNTSSGRLFVEQIIQASGLPLNAETLVDAVLDVVPRGFLPKKQIRQILLANRLSIFGQEAKQLDFENFGNAIIPNFADFAYLEASSKHLTRDSLQVYMRVPAKVGGVNFALSGGETVPGREVTTDEFQGDTIDYNFRLDESLAATNLPAWPGLDAQLFSSVTLRYSNTGPMGDYIAVDMHPASGTNGVVWEAEIGIPSKGSTYYYFEVMLAEPVSFTTLDREAIAAMDPLTVSLAEVFSATKEYTITGWAMPDPKNLQMVDRGIVDALFTPDLNRVITDILTSPRVANIIRKALAGQQVGIGEFLSAATPRQQNRITSILARNANRITTKFETAFDPMLASVFTVPRVNMETESLWVAEISNIADGRYYLGAVVHDADGNPLDQVQEMLTVDTSAPEASIQIMDGGNTTGYTNAEGIYVATAPDAGAAALNIMGVPKGADVGAGEGYLFYQEIALDADGNPLSTWMPLTIESTMLASRIWSAIVSRQGDSLAGFLRQAAPQLVGGLDNASIQALLSTTTPQSVLALLSPGLIQDFANPFLKSLEPFIGRFQLTESQSQLIIDALGGTLDIVDNLVPVTLDPSGHLTMPIQGDHMSLLIGDYGIRAMGIDTLFNLGAHTEPTRLRIVAPEADAASVTAVSIGDRNGDGDADEPYESGTIFANTTDGVMLTITIDNRTVHPAAINVQYMDANGMWQTIGQARELAENEEVAMYEVSWDVTDFDALVAAGDAVMVRAMATNGLQLTSVSESFAIKLDAGVHPVDFDVIALALDSESITKTNPDSGGPQGTVTISGYTPERTYPETTSFQLKVGDEVIGATSEGIVITAEEFKALEGNADIIDDLLHLAAGTIAAGEATESPIYRDDYPPHLTKWTVTVDTTALEDTITADSSAARDASKDESPHIVSASAITDAGELPAPESVKSLLSVDNVDDVGPLGPTNIVAVTNVADGIAPQPVEANEDESYTVGGIVDEAVPSPMDILTIEPTADPKTYASVKLIQTDADGNETVTDGEAGVLDITVDVGMLENGTYMFHALAVDEFGNVQADESPKTAVHVINFQVSDITDLAVTAVDGVDVAESPVEPIPLRNSLTVGFMVANGSLVADQLGASINGAAIVSEGAEDPEMTFSLSVMEISALPDGMYVPDGMVTQWNGSASFPLATINLDNTGPMVTIQTPSEDHTLDSLPTVHATYEDGAGSGADATGTGVLAWATTELANGPTVMLTRILPEQGDQDIMVDQGAIETDEATLIYTRTEQLPGGAYRATVQVADVLGNIGEVSVEFAIDGTLPAVAIHSPSSGQTFEHGEPLISGEFSGAGTVEVTTFTVNDVAATPEVDGNRFSYTPESALADGDHTVVVAVADGDGNTAQTSVSFTVKVPKDTTPPVISAVAPSGVINGDSWVTISAVVTDEQSSVVSAKFAIDDKPFRSVPLAQIAQGRIETAESFTSGTHSVTLVAISEGGTTQHSWTFTLVVDNVAPTITSITPTGTIRGGLPTISASANDESGVDEINIVVFDSDGEEVAGGTEDDGEDDVEGITRVDFIPEAPLDEGTYSIEVRATDTIGNSATAKGAFSIDFDTAAPVITMSSPQNEARLTERRPQISITFADAESGVDPDSIRFVFDDRLINLTPNQKSASQVIYTPEVDLAFGQHTVKLEVSDMAHKEGNVSEDSSGAREANMAVHEFTFFVESEAGPVLASRPINAPNPFKDNTRISFTLTRQSTVSIVIYDMTLRPVRVLVDNEVWDAGEYVGKGAIGWDGTSSSGEDLARGVYFCQIMVADGFEPEYAILKLALTR